MKTSTRHFPRLVFGTILGIVGYSFFLFVLAPVLVSQAHASTLYSQTNSATATPNTTVLGGTPFSGGKYGFGQILGTGLAGNVATTTVYLNASGGLANPVYGVKLECYTDSGYTSLDASCSSTNATKTITRNQGKVSFDFATPKTLDQTKYYRLGIGCNSGCSAGTNPNLITYGSAADLYSGGDFSTSTLNITDLYFELTGAPVDSISITTPTNGATSTVDFNNWGLDWNIGENNTSTAFIFEVNYGTNSTTPDFQDVFLYPNNTDPGEPVDFPKGNLLTPGVYYAQAVMKGIDFTSCSNQTECSDYTDYTVATSQQISFQFYYPGSSLWDPFNTSSTIPELNSTCDPDSNYFAFSLCKMLQFLFLPSNDSFSQFSGIQDLIKNKPPMGYFTIVSGLLDNVGTTTQASSSYSLASGIGHLPIFSQIRSKITILFWIFFAFWVLNRARHLDFHL